MDGWGCQLCSRHTRNTRKWGKVLGRVPGPVYTTRNPCHCLGEAEAGIDDTEVEGTLTVYGAPRHAVRMSTSVRPAGMASGRALPTQAAFVLSNFDQHSESSTHGFQNLQ